MSGQETIQELDRIVGTTNELLLSPEVKMMDVGGGVMRPTNAMVMTNLATLLGGAMPYVSVAEGLAGTVDGTNFSVLSSAQDEYVNVYRNESGSAVFVDSYPNAQAVRETRENLDSLEQKLSPYQNAAVGMDGGDPLGVFAGRDAQGNLLNLMAFMPDGTIRSTPLRTFMVEGMGGTTMQDVEIKGWGGYVFAQRDANGDLYAVTGSRADGSFYAPGVEQGGSSKILHVPFLGQSNIAGDQAKPPLSVAPTGWGNLMFARGVATWIATDNPNTPENRASGGFQLVDLVAASVETRANGFADAYKARITNTSRFSPESPGLAERILISFSGLGGRKLTELGPENDGASGRPGARTPGGHWPTLIDDIRRAKAAATAIGATYQLPAWIFDQGESEGDMTMYYSGDTLLPSDLVASYTTKALAMVTEFDVTARNIVGQTRPIPLFVTPASYNMLTSTAWQDVADASPLVFLVGPRYQMASAKNASNGLTGSAQEWGDEIHYNADGQRWIGDMCAKVMYRVLNEGEDWQPLRVLSARKVDATHVDLTFHVPRPPLIIDTEFLAKARGYGISIYGGTLNVPTDRQYATAAAIQADGRTVRMTFPSVPAGALLAVGQAYCDLGSYNVAAIGTGPATPNGFPTFTVSVAGDLRATLKPLTDEGAFLLSSSNGRGIVRSVAYDGANTVMTGEVRELTTPFTAGDALSFRRLNTYTNFRDSDNAMAINTFSAGTRAGKLYPLYNWACQYDGMQIQGA